MLSAFVGTVSALEQDDHLRMHPLQWLWRDAQGAHATVLLVLLGGIVVDVLLTSEAFRPSVLPGQQKPALRPPGPESGSATGGHCLVPTHTVGVHSPTSG
jgi:hypothetical protein